MLTTNSNDDPGCLKEYPGDCENLDAEACECVTDITCQCSDGLKNGNEEYIDCGGDCPDCEFDNNDCTLLTNGSTKVWKFAFITYTDRNDTTFGDELSDTEKNLILTFNVDYTFKEHSQGNWGPCYFEWSIDTQDALKILKPILIPAISDGGCVETVLGENEIVKLNADTFAFEYMQNEIWHFLPN